MWHMHQRHSTEGWSQRVWAILCNARCTMLYAIETLEARKRCGTRTNATQKKKWSQRVWAILCNARCTMSYAIETLEARKNSGTRINATQKKRWSDINMYGQFCAMQGITYFTYFKVC
eukprot:1154581-Pelagomonas_calceolata.AAC.2